MIYLRIAIAAAFLALAAVALWYRGNAIHAAAQAERARLELRSAIDANRMMKDALERATRLRDETDRILAELALELRDINQRAAEEADAINRLESQDEAVRDYLNTPIPDGLRRVLNAP